MGYKSPIDVIQEQMRLEMDNAIYKAVQKVDINVDREELIKALQYDRDQYAKGYADGCKETAEKIWNEINEFYFGLRWIGNCTVTFNELMKIFSPYLKELQNG